MSDFPILLVDDDAFEAKATRQAFARAQLSNPLYVARDGAEALELLTDACHTTEKPTLPRPGLILLDLNMPRMNGWEFLRHRRADPELAAVPVVVLTTSEQETGRREAYRLGISGYVVKPMEFDQFVQACKTIHRYWCLCALY